jgi:hypothetical protein
MSNKQLKALVNTVIKQSPVDSSQLTNPEEKFSLEKEHIIEINGYSDAPNNHWALQLKAPINGVTEWLPTNFIQLSLEREQALCFEAKCPLLAAQMIQALVPVKDSL